MPYSLINAPALGYDLARLPQGRQVADVLRTALACSSDDLAVLAGRHPGPGRLQRWCTMLDRASGGGGRDALLADRAVELALAGDGGSSALVLRRLERAALSDVAGLDRFLRHHLLDWTWLTSGDLAVQDPVAQDACDVLADGAASAYCSAHLDEELRRAMQAPYVAAGLALPGAASRHPGVRAVLDALARTDEPARRSWRRAVDDVQKGASGWAPAMHQATWAVAVSGRLRLAADAQLAAVEAFACAGFGARDASYGVWNAVSGAVQAAVTADLVPEQERRRLLAVWARVHGGEPPGC